MSLRARIFIIVSVIVLLILSVSIFLIIRSKRKANETPAPSDTTSTDTSNTVLPGAPTQNATDIPAGLPVKTITPLEAEKNGVEQLAKIFVERYGTYSTDNESQNIKESESLVTRSLWAKISAGINAKNTSQSFYGITTKVVSANLTSWSDTKATVSLRAIRTEDKNGAITTRPQTATVDMVKENGKWLASSIAWN